MDKKILPKLVILIVSFITVSCGPRQEEFDAQATMIVREILTSQAEKVPTNTPSPTLTSTPTQTQIPIPALLVPDAYPGIQAAIDAAEDGDVIIIPLGTYNENIDFSGKNITLRSTDPGDPEVVAATVIEGGGNGSVVTFQSSETVDARLEGFTITNGSNANGGGIAVVENSSPIITSNTISGNQAENSGGGIFISDNSSPTISGNVISSNWAKGGGGIGVHNSEPMIQNNTISKNTAEWLGGGITVHNSSLTISENTISSNLAETAGGIHISGNSSPTISGNTISDNQANFFGGGIFVRGNSSPTISDNTISGNEAESFGGGGIYVAANSIAKVINNQFQSNSTGFLGFEGDGNAIYVSDDSTLVLNTPDDNIYSGYPTNDIYYSSAKYIAYQETIRRFSGDIKRVLLDGTQAKKFIKETGVASGPAWSPDGSQIAFSYRDITKGEIYSSNIWVANQGGGNLTLLTHLEGVTSCPTWSPDGKQIAFRFNRSYTGTVVEIAKASIWVMNADGSNPKEIVKRDIIEIPSCPSWSPNGTKIAFTAMEKGTSTWDNHVNLPDGGFDLTGNIYLVNPDGRSLELLVDFTREGNTARGIAWSPDGSKLTFAYGYQEFGSDKPPFWHIYSINVDGADLIQLTSDGNVNACPSWSSDGTKILFHSDRDGDFDLYIMNSDGSDQTRIFHSEGDQLCPVWQP